MSSAIKQDLPKEYETGLAIFCELEFYVDKNVLIPRIETEDLVYKTREYVNSTLLELAKVTILDVGTGSGCVAVALAKFLPSAHVTAVDVSEFALEVAAKNAEKYSVSSQIHLVKSDLVSLLSDNARFDVIVTNLPYIPTKRIENLQGSVKDHEPKLALDGGADGFELYKNLFEQLVAKRIDFRLLLAEIDETQGGLARKVVKKYFPKAKCEIVKDKYGYDRFVQISC